MSDRLTPTTAEGVASALAEAAAAGRAVHIVGAGTKADWLPLPAPGAVALSTAGLNRRVIGEAPDGTVEFAAGATLAAVQAELARDGRRLALDPPLGDRARATLGGIIATGDCGPLAHRYGPPREQLIAATVALSDGTVVRCERTVSRGGWARPPRGGLPVDGRGLLGLTCGAFGTLGVILSTALRVRPLPEQSATVLAALRGPEEAARAVHRLAREAVALEALDLGWRGGRGGLLAQLAGPHVRRHADRLAALLRQEGLGTVQVREDDRGLWEAQRALQRSARRAVVRVQVPLRRLVELLHLADECEATLAGRAGRGEFYLQVAPRALARLTAGLGPDTPAVVQACPVPLPAGARWSHVGDGELALMRAIKATFDPAGICNPGILAGHL